MGALREAVLEPRPAKGPLCKVAVLRDKLEPDDRAELDELLAEDVEATVLAEKIRAIHHFMMNPHTIRRHRQSMRGEGGCRCPQG